MRGGSRRVWMKQLCRRSRAHNGEHVVITVIYHSEHLELPEQKLQHHGSRDDTAPGNTGFHVNAPQHLL
ncbi:hypothetical protein EYF80_025951 [Liparis tanakae]|uniref:Uncharacterized protein n=1 Tax=Liparis tanakae TaxID=230148 RepID=A0A4Z2HFT4_9TELE|nr:hypothetical protein EYF80_025951 [Liparis tanakae]